MYLQSYSAIDNQIGQYVIFTGKCLKKFHQNVFELEIFNTKPSRNISRNDEFFFGLKVNLIENSISV